MFKFSEMDAFTPFITSVRETSYDNANDEYMTSNETDVVNFDDYTDSYTASHGIPSVRSIDALYSSDCRGNIFIEFKNGKIDNKVIYEIKEKIYNSLLILSDVTGRTLKNYRQNLDFILVYNKEKNPSLFAEIPAPSNSPSLDGFVENLSGKGQRPFKPEGLESLESYCFKNVKRMSVSEFEEELHS